jgi:hypothetical protein
VSVVWWVSVTVVSWVGCLALGLCLWCWWLDRRDLRELQRLSDEVARWAREIEERRGK